MTVPKALREKYLAELKALIDASDELLAGKERRLGRARRRLSDGSVTSRGPDFHVVNSPEMVKWKTKCVSLLAQIIPPNHPNFKILNEFQECRTGESTAVEELAGRLRGIHDSFRDGFLDDAWSLIRAEVAADYLTQAETLLVDGCHVPAAVLAGAVLEDTLRKLAVDKRIDLQTKKGRPKTIDPLNVELKKSGVYSAVKAKEIDGWAGIRNAAAHGKPDEFKPDDVRRMVEGVRAFVGEHLK